jgi:hypothetical protein
LQAAAEAVIQTKKALSLGRSSRSSLECTLKEVLLTMAEMYEEQDSQVKQKRSTEEMVLTVLEMVGTQDFQARAGAVRDGTQLRQLCLVSLPEFDVQCEPSVRDETAEQCGGDTELTLDKLRETLNATRGLSYWKTTSGKYRTEYWSGYAKGQKDHEGNLIREHGEIELQYEGKGRAKNLIFKIDGNEYQFSDGSTEGVISVKDSHGKWKKMINVPQRRDGGDNGTLLMDYQLTKNASICVHYYPDFTMRIGSFKLDTGAVTHSIYADGGPYYEDWRRQSSIRTLLR